MRNVIFVAVVILVFVLGYAGVEWIVRNSEPAPSPSVVTSGHQSIDGQLTACVNCKVDALQGDVSQYKVIHKRSAVCPAGWTMLKGYFTESDLNRMDACSNPRSAYYDVDYLLSGESFPATVTTIAH